MDAIEKINEYLPPSIYKGQERGKIFYGFLANYNSEGTRRAYLFDLKVFLLFLRKHFLSVSETQVEHAHIVAYKEYLLKTGLGERSVNRKLATLGAFYKYLYDQEIISKNPADRIKRFKVSKICSTNDLTNDEVKRLIDSVDVTNGSGLLHRAILGVLFSTGMRSGELANLKFKNIERNSGLLILKYKAKGNKTISVPLSEKCKFYLGKWFEWCEQNGYSMAENEYIFRPTVNQIGDVNKKIAESSLIYIFKKYAKLANIETRITPHSARSTVIGSLLVDKEISIERVADFVGHSDMSQTKSYLKRKRNIQNSPAFDLDII